jgi:hypothetical protein
MIIAEGFERPFEGLLIVRNEDILDSAWRSLACL